MLPVGCLSAALLLVLPACGRGNVQNPSGSCGARSDGARAGYHLPGDDVWIPDCSNVLQREYWRVFSPDDKTAYVIPRLDGARELKPICADATHELRGLIERYGLCAPASSTAQVERVNLMEIVDALRVTHFLHTRLRFSVTPQQPWGIEPSPLASDIIDACRLGGQPSSSDLAAICRREQDRLRRGHDVAFGYVGRGAAELVARLNRLYGVR